MSKMSNLPWPNEFLIKDMRKRNRLYFALQYLLVTNPSTRFRETNTEQFGNGTNAKTDLEKANLLDIFFDHILINHVHYLNIM